MEVNLTSKLPRGTRNVEARLADKTPERIRISRQFGQEYFDGDRSYGYGGYNYDGRWLPVAQDMVRWYSLRSGARVLDIGCAKGFLVKEFGTVGMNAFGLDISDYALSNCHPDVVGRLHKGNAVDLPFPDHSFDVVICINTLHNLPRDLCIQALKEIERVTTGGKAYIQVDSYNSKAERELFLEWALTCETHGYHEDWLKIFAEAGYTGDFNWTYL